MKLWDKIKQICKEKQWTTRLACRTFIWKFFYATFAIWNNMFARKSKTKKKNFPRKSRTRSFFSSHIFLLVVRSSNIFSFDFIPIIHLCFIFDIKFNVPCLIIEFYSIDDRIMINIPNFLPFFTIFLPITTFPKICLFLCYLQQNSFFFSS